MPEDSNKQILMMVADQENKGNVDGYANNFPLAPVPNGRMLNYPQDINLGQPSGPSGAYSSTNLPQMPSDISLPQLSQQESPSHLLECLDEWGNMTESCMPPQAVDCDLAIHSAPHLDPGSAVIFPSSDLSVEDPNSNNNNNNVLPTNHQLPSLSTFSRSLQSRRNLSSPVTLSNALAQPNSLVPASPFSSASSSYDLPSSNCAGQSGIWLPETPNDGISVGGPSPFSSPEKQAVCPDYFNNISVPGNALQLRI